MSMTRERAAEWFETHMPTGGVKPVQKQAYLMALSALRPVSREQIEQNKRRWEVQTSIFPYYYCSGCGESFAIHSYDKKEKYRFCPCCMSPMTDEAVDIMLKRMEALLND